MQRDIARQVTKCLPHNGCGFLQNYHCRMMLNYRLRAISSNAYCAGGFSKAKIVYTGWYSCGWDWLWSKRVYVVFQTAYIQNSNILLQQNTSYIHLETGSSVYIYGMTFFSLKNSWWNSVKDRRQTFTPSLQTRAEAGQVERFWDPRHELNLDTSDLLNKFVLSRKQLVNQAGIECEVTTSHTAPYTYFANLVFMDK